MKSLLTFLNLCTIVMSRYWNEPSIYQTMNRKDSNAAIYRQPDKPFRHPFCLNCRRSSTYPAKRLRDNSKNIFVLWHEKVDLRGNVVLVHVTEACLGVQVSSSDSYPRTTWGWVVNATPRPFYPRERDLVAFVQKAGRCFFLSISKPPSHLQLRLPSGILP